MIWTVLIAMLAGAALVLLFVPRLPASLLALAAMWLFQLTQTPGFSDFTLIFWTVFTVIELATLFLEDKTLRRATTGVPFIRGGVIAGAFAGMALNRMDMLLLGAVTGGLFGFLAFTRTRAAEPLNAMPPRRRFEYFAAKAFGAIDTASMVCITLSALVAVDQL